MKAKSPLDSIKPYLRFAIELDASEPLVAYSCRLYYVSSAIEIMKQHAEVKTPQFTSELSTVMKKMAEQKQQLRSDDIGLEVENYVSNKFVEVIKSEETDPEITKKHAISFHQTQLLITLLKQHSLLTPEWEEKKKYCQAKAASINKCLKNGTQPERGKPKGQSQLNSQPEIPTLPQQKPITEEPPKQPFIQYQPVQYVPQQQPITTQPIKETLAIDPAVKFSIYDTQKKITKYHNDYYSIIDKATKEVEYGLNELQFKKVKIGKENLKKALALLEQLSVE